MGQERGFAQRIEAREEAKVSSPKKEVAESAPQTAEGEESATN